MIRSLDRVGVDKTAIQLDDERYWLYAAVDPETNDLLHTKLESVSTNVFAHTFFTELRENTASMEQRRSKMCALDTASISDANVTKIETASNVSFVR